MFALMSGTDICLNEVLNLHMVIPAVDLYISIFKVILSHKTGILEEEPQNVMIINMIGSVVEKDVLVFSANIEMSEVLHKKFFSS